MKSSPIQNILILILIVANLFLLGQNIFTAAKSASDKKDYDTSAKAVLESKGITLADEVTVRTGLVASVYDRNSGLESFTQLAAELFGCNAEDVSRFVLPSSGVSFAHNKSSLTISPDGDFSYNTAAINSSELKNDDIGYTDTVSNEYEKSLAAFFKTINGIGTVSADACRREDNVTYVKCSQTVSGIPVCAGNTVCAIDETGTVIAADGTWFFASEPEISETKLYGQLSALFSLTDKYLACTINVIEIVYRIMPYDNSAAMLVPTYRINVTSDNGKSGDIYICAVTGEERTLS